MGTALCAGMTIALAGFIPGASAQVLEIGGDGAVIVHDRAEVTLSQGATPIVSAPTHRHGGRRASGVVSHGDVASAAEGADLSPDLVEAVAWRESRLRHGLVSPKGAIGEMQLMPTTAAALGVDPFDADQNLRGGAAYLRGLMRRYDGDIVRALAAYNAGPGAVDRYGGVPPFKETRDYVANILDNLSERALRASSPATPER